MRIAGEHPCLGDCIGCLADLAWLLRARGAQWRFGRIPTWGLQSQDASVSLDGSMVRDGEEVYSTGPRRDGLGTACTLAGDLQWCTIHV